MDLTVRTPHIPAKGETIFGGDVMMSFGGKGANQAVAVARLGGEATFISKVGTDANGKMMVEHFAEELDVALRAVNSDYDAKRRSTIERQHLTLVERGFFLEWLQLRGKNKVPRLVNDRRIADDLHEVLKQKRENK